MHAMSYPLGGKYHLPHGVANAILLAPCMQFVRPAAVSKFAQAYDLLPDADSALDEEAKSHALVAYFAALVQRLKRRPAGSAGHRAGSSAVSGRSRAGRAAPDEECTDESQRRRCAQRLPDAVSGVKSLSMSGEIMSNTIQGVLTAIVTTLIATEPIILQRSVNRFGVS